MPTNNFGKRAMKCKIPDSWLESEVSNPTRDDHIPDKALVSVNVHQPHIAWNLNTVKH